MSFHTCTLCEAPESAVTVNPEQAKHYIYLCKLCTREAVKAWAKAAGPVWSIVTRKELEAKKLEREYFDGGTKI